MRRRQAARQGAADRFGSLAGVLAASPAELRSGPGAGEAVAFELKLLAEVGLRVGRATVGKRPVISSWSQLLDYVKLGLAHAPREQFRVLFLDRNCASYATGVANQFLLAGGFEINQPHRDEPSQGGTLPRTRQGQGRSLRRWCASRR